MVFGILWTGQMLHSSILLLEKPCLLTLHRVTLSSRAHSLGCWTASVLFSPIFSRCYVALMRNWYHRNYGGTLVCVPLTYQVPGLCDLQISLRGPLLRATSTLQSALQVCERASHPHRQVRRIYESAPGLCSRFRLLPGANLSDTWRRR